VSLLKRPLLWLPLLLTAGMVLLAPYFRAQQTPLQSHAMALLITLTLVLSGYLFTAMIQPEKF
jgi:K+-transporting ATPase KdpF subunit